MISRIHSSVLQGIDATTCETNTDTTRVDLSEVFNQAGRYELAFGSVRAFAVATF